MTGYQAVHKTTGEPRTHRLGLYFTAAEWVAIEQLAKADGNLNVHDWVLATVLSSAEVTSNERRIQWPGRRR